MDNIVAIKIIFENGDNILIDKKEFADFYISNLNNQGEEIPYESTLLKNKLYANFCLLKLNNQIIDYTKINRLKQKSDITEIQIIFNNNKFLKFDIASDADPFAEKYENSHEYIYEDENTFGLLLSEYNIKYKENLFA